MAVLAEAAPGRRAGVARRGVPRATRAGRGGARPRWSEFGTALRAAVRAGTGLPASVGAGSGKQLAKIASELAKPDGLRVVAPDEEQHVLAPLPVRALWGVGPVAEAALHRLGVRTVGALAALDLREATDVLGVAMGTELHRLARGIDERPVAPRGAAKQVSAETTFDADLTTMTAVHDAVARIAEAAHRRLLASGRAARTVTVKIRSADFTTAHPLGDGDARDHGPRDADGRRPAAGPRRGARGRGPPDRGVAGGAGRRAAAGAVRRRRARRRGTRTTARRTDDGVRASRGAGGADADAGTRPRTHVAARSWRAGDDVTTPSTGTAGCRAPGTAASPCGSRPAAPGRAAPAPWPRTTPPCARRPARQPRLSGTIPSRLAGTQERASAPRGEPLRRGPPLCASGVVHRWRPRRYRRRRRSRRLVA